MTTICADTVKANLLYLPRSWGVSESANALNEQFADLQMSLIQTVTIGAHYQGTLRKLAEAFQTSAVDNWDGYGAKPIDQLSCFKAIRFSALLPMDVPLADIDIDTDGEARFEWYRGPRQIFSVTVRGDGELAYAGLFGASKVHGTEYLGDELPRAILDNIYRICA